MAASPCDPGANPFVSRVFGECVYDGRDMAGFVAGLASIACWMGAQAPQIIRNARTRSAAALSPWFLAEWLLGDTCNLIGCLLTGDQLRTMVFTAMYFICTDVVLVLQFILYSASESAASRRHERVYAASRARRLGAPLPAATAATLAAAALASSAPGVARAAAAASHRLVGAASARPGPPPPTPPTPTPPTPASRHAAGVFIAWLSSSFYIGSRISQLAKNAARGSAEGLALSMFGSAIAANVLYAASIIARARAPGDLAASAPWLVGSLGTVALDGAVFWQARALARAAVARAAARRARRAARRGGGVGATLADGGESSGLLGGARASV